VDRRSELRPWRKGSPGRRWEDELRRDLAGARLALEEAEARLAAFERAREGADVPAQAGDRPA
jgi:hypothetical protein